MKEKSIHSLMFDENDVVSPLAAFIWCVILCNWFYYHIWSQVNVTNQPNNSPPRYHFWTSCINYISSQTILNNKNDLSCTRRFKLKDKLMINNLYIRWTISTITHKLFRPMINLLNFNTNIEISEKLINGFIWFKVSPKWCKCRSQTFLECLLYNWIELAPKWTENV